MTKSKTRKRLVRARMAKTGESYQAAHRNVVPPVGESPSNAADEQTAVATEDVSFGSVVAERASTETAGDVPLATIPSTGPVRFFLRLGDRSVEVGPHPVTVGRVAGNTIRLDDDLRVSKNHATFTATAGRLVVRDEWSANGVWVNFVRVRNEQELKHGDVVIISKSRFVIEPAPIAPAPLQRSSVAVGAADTPALGTVIAGRYRLDRVVAPAKGPLAGDLPEAPWTELDAQHVVLGGDVTIKILPTAASVGRTYLKSWLLREGRALQRAAHPGVAKVLDIGETESGSVYLVLERLPALTLDACIPAGGLSEARALEHFLPLLDAVGHLHERGVVHRDLRCGTIRMNDDRPILTSFALATIEGEPRLTPTGTPLGHPAWASPEQRAGNEVDARSDLYSLGVVLHALATGRLPVGAVARDELPPLHTGAAPSALDVVVRRLLAASPADRYESAAAVKAALA